MWVKNEIEIFYQLSCGWCRGCSAFMAIGIFDSGLGGLTVLDAVQDQLPDVQFLYFADSAHAPYGVRASNDIHDLTNDAVHQLWDRGCNLVILACNTASAVALRRIQESGVPQGKRVLGVFVPLIEVITERKWGDNSPPREVTVKNVALFATPATVASRAFQREFAFRSVGVAVGAQAFAGVVDAIESGDLILARELVRSHVEALMRKMPNPQAAVLGCTHYPLLFDIFQEALGANVNVYSQGSIVAESLADYLMRHENMVGDGDGGFITTGDADTLSEQAAQFLGRWIDFKPV